MNDVKNMYYNISLYTLYKLDKTYPIYQTCAHHFKF